jgi:hypothetical protein
MVSVAVKQARMIARVAKARWKRERIVRMLDQIASGRDRDTAIAEARALGSRLQEIGSAIGRTRERVRQICYCQAIRSAAPKRPAGEGLKTVHVQEGPIGQSAGTPEEGQ